MRLSQIAESLSAFLGALGMWFPFLTKHVWQAEGSAWLQEGSQGMLMVVVTTSLLPSHPIDPSMAQD